jgi:hypothetical protein
VAGRHESDSAMSRTNNEIGELPFDVSQLFLSDDMAKLVAENAKKAVSEKVRRKRPTTRFFRMTPGFCRKLCEEKAPWTVWALVYALCDAWYVNGWHEKRPNPFPLNKVDIRKWGLTRSQKSRALKFLVQVRLIRLDQSNPKSPMVTIAWEPLYAS